jgi:hypothetical protein
MIIVISSLFLVSFLFGLYILSNIEKAISDGFNWHKEWLRSEKNYKRRIYELQTDLEAEKRETSILRLELDLATKKLNSKGGPRTQ